MEGAHGGVERMRVSIERLVREEVLELGREAEARSIAHQLGPLLGVPRAGRAVERGVDLEAVEVAREVPQRVEALRLPARIDDALPVGIGPPGGTDADHRRSVSPTRSSAAKPLPRPMRSCGCRCRLADPVKLALQIAGLFAAFEVIVVTV